MKDPHTNTIEIGEYLCAAAMRAAGVPLVSVKPNSSGRVSFIFDDTDEQAQNACDAHLQGRLNLNSRDFADAVQSIKTVMWEARRMGGLY